MFEVDSKRTRTRGAFDLLAVIYHATVREVRRTHRNPMIGLLINIAQTLILVLTFYFLFQLLGLRSSAVRGDFMLYIMSGIFMYFAHTKTMMAVVNSEGPASPMMQHRPMNTAIAISAAAMSALYLQTLSLIVVLFIYHAAVTPITIDQPAAAFCMVLVAWISGAAVGMIFLAIKPWAPNFATIGAGIYSRANMIASGKMFLANSLPSSVIVLFDWNPLFHAIDQTRGYVFLHYNPHFTNWQYPLYLSATLIMIGLMGEFYTRKRASISWTAAQ